MRIAAQYSGLIFQRKPMEYHIAKVRLAMTQCPNSSWDRRNVAARSGRPPDAWSFSNAAALES